MDGKCKGTVDPDSRPRGHEFFCESLSGPVIPAQAGIQFVRHIFEDCS
jgi:hypothetical protein